MNTTMKNIDDERELKAKGRKFALNHKIKLLINNDDLWNICTFIVVFIVMLILSYLNIYGVTDSVIYSFSFASLLLSISQVIHSIWSKIFYMIGYIVLILGGGIDIQIINNIKSILNENTLLILSLIVIFIGFLVNKINSIESNNKRDISKKEINTYLDYLDVKYSEDKKNILDYVSEMKMLIEVSDIEMSEKIRRGQECYNNIKCNSEYEKSIEFIRFKIEEVLNEEVK